MDASELKAADDANAEGAWMDLVAAFDRDRPCAQDSTIARMIDELSASLVSLPAPMPKVTLVNKVARFVLRRF